MLDKLRQHVRILTLPKVLIDFCCCSSHHRPQPIITFSTRIGDGSRRSGPEGPPNTRPYRESPWDLLLFFPADITTWMYLLGLLCFPFRHMCGKLNVSTLLILVSCSKEQPFNSIPPLF